MTQTSKIGFGELRNYLEDTSFAYVLNRVKKKKKIYTCAFSHVGLFLQLKVTLAPCIEGLILLDRLCYLKEQVKKTQKTFGFIKMSNPA